VGVTANVTVDWSFCNFGDRIVLGREEPRESNLIMEHKMIVASGTACPGYPIESSMGHFLDQNDSELANRFGKRLATRGGPVSNDRVRKPVCIATESPTI
jgi:hypothetical protein